MKRRKIQPRNGLVEIGELLEGALKQLGAKSDYELFRVGKQCRELLGDRAANALVEVSFKDSQVGLQFNHSIWLNEMNFRKAELLTQLQSLLPDLGIKSINLGLARSPKSKA
jgi:hypothetical protein